MMAQNTAVARGDDMHETAEELGELSGTPVLRFAVATLAAEITPAFDDADRKALVHQRSYRAITRVATIFGTISILLSILGLVATELSRPILIVQTGALIITGFAVLMGLLAYRHENWLLERCRAEQLRALKFHRLLDAALWSGDERDRLGWAERVRTEVERTRALRYQDIAAIAGMEDVPGLGPRYVPDAASLEALVAYYDRKRLSPQREYFLRASRDPHHFGARTLPLFFFGALVVELFQVVIQISAEATDTVSMFQAAMWLSAAAIALPAIWAGIRTYQGAREDSRNATRSKARHGALTQLSERLLAARGNPVELFWTMRLTEFVLQVDQREWLRLLREAEWYG